MADEDVFSLIIDVQSKGVRATERELVAATEALNSLQLGTDITSESFETLSTAFARALKEVRTLLGDTRHFLAVEKQLARETDAAVKALQGLDSQFSKADRSIASATKTLENFHAEQRRNSAVFNAEGDRAAAWDEEFRALERVTDAQREFAEAVQASSSRNEQARRQDAVRDRELQAAAAYEAAQAEREFAEAVQASFARNEQARRADAVRDRELQAAAIQQATEAEMRAANATQNFTGNLPRLRYALYDVSSALTMAGAAMTALGVATFGTAIKMDRAFADVLRTTETFGAAGNAASKLRQEFEELFTSMPVSWSDLTEIGTLAGQLNIARDSVAEFTELVAMFAATTDVSVEQAATAFGRLSQLLDVPASELQNLGSSILAVGVNSIATESQIIAISAQITSMASTAGFTADQVFGLSAALASLGTQPELSRGVVVRLFTNITRAIDQGGERLDAFGRVAGTTGAEFARAWGDDAAGALLSLMQGLGAIEQTKAVATLNELGIVAARDVPTILRLAQNSEVLAESLQVAAQGYADGSALGEQYNVIASTVAEKLNVLVNNFQNLIATIGQSSGMLGGLVDVAIGLVKVLTALADNPVASTFLGIAVAGIAVVGIVSLLSGVALRGVASVVAMATAWTEFNAVGVTSIATMRAMVSSMFGVTTSSATAATAVRGLSAAMRLIPGIGLALAALSAGWALFEQATRSAQDRAEDFFGSLAGFQEAIQQDTQVWRETGQAIGTFETAVESAESSTDNAVVATKIWLGTQKDVPPAVDDATNAITHQTQALGENAEAWIRNALLNSKARDQLINLANDPALRAAAEQAGLDIQELIAAGLASPGENGAYAYVQQIYEALSPATISRFSDLDIVATLFFQLAEQVDNLIGSNRELAVTHQFLAGTTDQATERLRELNEAALESYSDFIDITKATLDLEGSIHDLGASLAENGNSFDEFTEAGRNNISALLKTMDALAAQTPGDAEATAAAFRGLYDFLVKGANVSASSLTVLAKAIEELGGVSTQVTAFNPDSFFEGWSKSVTKAGSATSSAAKKVRTLVDYARDLRSTFSRAFDLRFDVSSTADKITSSFINIRNASEEAARNIRSLQADILGLTSDISIQEYFLSIAVAYGDTERAAAIEANLAKLRADLEGKTADLAKEEAKHSKTLVGNSEAAIENRAEMEALVQQYQAHLEALAASGMSQADLAKKAKELRDQFLQQAVALGYNAAELKVYTAVFDDMAKIIAKVPRKVNVDVSTAGLDPATQAIREFDAALKTAQTTASKGLSVNTPKLPSSYYKWLRGLALEAELAQLSMNLRYMPSAASNVNAARTMATRIKTIKDALNSGSYAEGGFTGRGGKYEPAGIVHRGEYVVPKHMVNQSTGLPYADAMGKLQKGASGPGYARGGFVSGGNLAPNGHITSFGPMAQQQLQHALQQIVTLDGKTISNSSAQQYADQTTVGAY